MNFEHPLTVGRHIFSDALIPFVFLHGSLTFETTGDVLAVKGSELHYCVIDLLNGNCPEIKVTEQSRPAPLQWRVHHISEKKASQTMGGMTPRFQALVPPDWLVFEGEREWHCYPVRDLIRITLVSSALLFVYRQVTIEVTASFEELETLYDQWAQAQQPPRHYTMRPPEGYLGVIPSNRFLATKIFARRCIPKQSQRGRSSQGSISFRSCPDEPLSRGRVMER